MRTTGNDIFYIAIVILIIAIMQFWSCSESDSPAAHKPNTILSLDVAGPANFIDFNKLPPTAAGPAGPMLPGTKMQAGIVLPDTSSSRVQVCTADGDYNFEDVNELPSTAAGPATAQVLPVGYTLPPLNMPIAVTPNAGGGCKGSPC